MNAFEEKQTRCAAAVIAVAAISLASATHVCAQTTSGAAGLEEVIVTAAKREQSLQEVPMSVSAITGDALVAMNITQTQQLSAVIPSLQIASAFGDTMPNFTLRGVGVANEFNSNATSPVGVYVDEMYQSFRFMHGAQLYDLDRLEVVSGPQGTLYGRNTTGGAVNIITRKPALQGSNGALTVGYGNFDRSNVQGAFEFTPVDDVLGVRIAAKHSEGDGYFDEPNPTGARYHAHDYATADATNARAQILWKPADSLSLLLKAYYADDDSTGYPVVTVGACNPADLPACNPAPAGVTPVDFFGYSRAGLAFDEVSQDTNGKYGTESRGTALTAKWSSGAFTVTSISGYDKSEFVAEQDCDGTPNNACNVDYGSNGNQFNQDLRLGYTGDRVVLVAGAYYGYDHLWSDNFLRFYNVFPDATSALDFNPAGGNPLAPPTSFNVLQRYEQLRHSSAAYSELTYKLTDRWELTGGLRYSKDTIKYRNGNSTAYTDIGGSPLLIPGTPPTPLNLISDLNQKHESSTTSGRVIVNYAWTDEVRTYASYSKGYRAGTYNGFAYSSPLQVFFVPPETLQAYEVGFKSRFWDQRAQINGAVYSYDYGNQQVQEILAAIGVLTNVDAEVKGAELEIVLNPIARLTLKSTTGYADATYVKNRKSVLTGVEVGGNELPQAPKLTQSLSFEYTLADTGLGELALAGGGNYTSEYWFDPFNDFGPYGSRDGAMRAPGRWLFDARLSLSSAHWIGSLWGRNLADKHYYSFGADSKGGFGQWFYLPGAPRTFGVDLTYSF